MSKIGVAPLAVSDAYYGSSAAETRRILRELESVSSTGRIAAELFRAQKASSRAKVYGRMYRGHAYRRKGDHLETLCYTLDSLSTEISWGWGTDDLQPRCPWVLYVDLPTGQVSFHSPERYAGPDYPGEWDKVPRASESRILKFCQSLLAS